MLHEHGRPGGYAPGSDTHDPSPQTQTHEVSPNHVDENRSIVSMRSENPKDPLHVYLGQVREWEFVKNEICPDALALMETEGRRPSQRWGDYVYVPGTELVRVYHGQQSE